jgi:hypothetical protein
MTGPYGPTCKHDMFLRKYAYKDKEFFGINHLDRCILAELTRNVEISFVRSVWGKTICCFMSDITRIGKGDLLA